MSTPTTSVEKFDVQKLNPPDTSTLPKIDFASMLLLKVTDEDTLQTARANAVSARDYVASVQAIFDEPTNLAHRLHKWFTSMRSKLTDPAEKAEKHAKREIEFYLEQKELQRQELERKLQREAQVVADAARKQQEAALDPFELMQRIESPAPPPPTVPAVRVAPESHCGVGLANKPWTYEVVDKKAFCQFILKDENWDLLNGYLILDDAGLKAQAKQWQAALGDKFPGLKGVRPQRVNVK